MSANTVGFLGAGRVVRILLEGWQRAGVLPVEVVVHDTDPGAVAQLQGVVPGVRATPDAWILGQMARVFVAVHPPALLDALQPLAVKLRPDAVVVSLAPKVKIARMIEALGGFGRVARSIPNAPSAVGSGFNPVAFGPDLPEADRLAVLDLLSPLGACPVVLEEHLEAYAILTAMGPTYFWFQLQQLRELGASFGLPAADVDAGLTAMVAGTAQTLLASGRKPEEVMDLIPVKPLKEDEEAIRTAYRTRLTALYQKLVGQDLPGGAR
jgi:pyrroline-5-carboxylate reductase